jgi:hypothetical protein
MKMKTKLRFSIRSLLIALLLATGQAALATEAYERPALPDMPAKLSYLAYIRDHIPFLFEEVAQYDKDILALLDAESTLLAALKEMPDYVSKNTERKDLVQLKIDTIAPGRGQIRVLKEGVAQAWKTELAATLATLNSNRGRAKPLVAIKEALDAILPELVKKSPSGLLTGLINSLPRESRGAAFKLSQTDQLAYVTANLSDEAFRSSFRASNFGLDAENLTRSDVLALTERMLAQEKAAIELVKLAAFAAESGVPSVAQLRTKIVNADEKALTALVEAKSVEKALTALDSDSAWKKQTAGFSKSAENSFKPYYESAEGNVPVVAETHTLREMPPNLALFRGFIGGDCSTSYSYGFAYVPTERYFFLYNQAARLYRHDPGRD